MTELTYSKSGDYQIPDLSLTRQENRPLGKYGRMRKKYLKEQRPILWSRMVLNESLNQHLWDIEETANQRLDQLVPRLMEEAGVTEELKASDPMTWVGLMNNCKAQAEETILIELIYA